MQISYIYTKNDLKYTFYLVWNWTCFYLLSWQCQISRREYELQKWVCNFELLIDSETEFHSHDTAFLWEFFNFLKINKIHDETGIVHGHSDALELYDLLMFTKHIHIHCNSLF